MKEEDVTMNAMNDDVRRAVRIELARRDMRQTDLAELVGVKPQYLSDMMRGKVGKIPEAWQKVLDALGLDLVAVPREDR